jgi:glycine/D-amino acid oxidase-like deaminating enzyme
MPAFGVRGQIKLGENILWCHWVNVWLQTNWAKGHIMQQKIIVVGAGIIGASIAYQLAKSGAAVTIIEASMPASQASGASFGWINASFFANADHFALRAAGIAAHHRLAKDLGDTAPQFPGCLWWEFEGDAFDAQAQTLRELGYGVDEIDAREFAQLEPHIARPPKRCLRFSGEGAVDAALMTAALLGLAAQHGAKLITGVAVSELVEQGGRVQGVDTSVGRFRADQVVIAGGNGSGALLKPFGVDFEMLRRPGLILRTRPVPLALRHILVLPGQEVRQLRDGRILAPTAASHQSDSSDTITERPDILADTALARLRDVMPTLDLAWETVSLALRPVPQDGLPVIGACGPDGAYIATMHSGVTLCALVGELVAGEVLADGQVGNAQAALLAPFRPSRFD